MLYNPYKKTKVKRITTGATYELKPTDSLVIFDTGAPVTVTVPLASENPGWAFTLISTANNITLALSGSDNTAAPLLTSDQKLTYVSDGVADYMVVGFFPPA